DPDEDHRLSVVLVLGELRVVVRSQQEDREGLRRSADRIEQPAARGHDRRGRRLKHREEVPQQPDQSRQRKAGDDPRGARQRNRWPASCRALYPTGGKFTHGEVRSLSSTKVQRLAPANASLRTRYRLAEKRSSRDTRCDLYSDRRVSVRGLRREGYIRLPSRS